MSETPKHTPHLKVYSSADLGKWLRHRPGEVRLGEKVQTLPPASANEGLSSLKACSARYVILGLPEDIGVRANFGRGGAYSSWQPVISTLLNSQSNRFLSGGEILVLGHVDFSAYMNRMKVLDLMKEADLATARELVSEMDAFLRPLFQSIAEAGKELIVVGGGHNNAFPLLSGYSQALKSPLNCINCDAHADLRPLEGRHSGNAFSYALSEGFLNRYAMLGLHENFNAASVCEQIESDERLMAIWYEDIFIRDHLSFEEAVEQCIDFAGTAPLAIELDVDAIQNIPSSAKTSSGLAVNQARYFVYQTALSSPVSYLHITEAAPVLSHIKTDLKTGKLITYLISDFIKARNLFHSEHEHDH